MHLYDNSVLDWHLENGTPLKIEQKTNYPWEGSVRMSVSPAQATDFTLYVRIPGWVRNAKVTMNGKTVEGAQAGQYLAIKRNWKSGDSVTLDFPLSTEVITSNPRVAEDAGRVAVQRGPIVFCMEQMDQPSGVDLADVSFALTPKLGQEFQVQYKSDLLDGVAVLHHEGMVYESPSATQPLYQASTGTPPKTRRSVLRSFRTMRGRIVSLRQCKCGFLIRAINFLRLMSRLV